MRLKKENLRDNMSNTELVLNMLAETSTTDISKAEQPNGFVESQQVARLGGEVAGIEFGFTIENAPRFTAFATTAERLEQQLNREHRPMYAFYDNGIIAGYYSLALQENHECELNNLCVLPTYRHQGIGETLLQHAFETAKGFNCREMNIGIVEENKALKKWYESFGFIYIGTRKFDFFPFTCGYMKKQLMEEE